MNIIPVPTLPQRSRPTIPSLSTVTRTPFTPLPSGAECSAGETGKWGRGADTAVYPTAAEARITSI